LRDRSQIDYDPDQGHLWEPSPLGEESPTGVGSYSKIRLVRQLRLTRNRAAQGKQETRGRLSENSEAAELFPRLCLQAGLYLPPIRPSVGAEPSRRRIAHRGGLLQGMNQEAATVIAMRTSSARDPASIFSMTCARCASTVLALTFSSAAISLLDLPLVTISMTWLSRFVS